MQPNVKVCGLTRPEDARAATRLGVDYLGAIFYPKSPRCVKAETLEDLLLFMPDGKRVMVDVSPEYEALEKRLDLGFDFFQIHFDVATTPREVITRWSSIVHRERLWLAPRLKPEDPLPDYILELAGTLVMDTYKPGLYGGTGQTGEWARFAKLKETHPDLRVALAGGINPENVLAAIEETNADMIDLNSGVESAPGIKDAKKIAAVMDALYKRQLKNNG